MFTLPRATGLRSSSGESASRCGWARLAIMGLVLCGACGTVAPYQREDLARSSMDLSTEAHEVAFRSHVHDSREGATGGHGSTGGGCGCN